MQELTVKRPFNKGDLVYDRTPRHEDQSRKFAVDRVIGVDSDEAEVIPEYKDQTLLANGYACGDCIIRSISGSPQRQPAKFHLLEHAS